MGKGPGEGLYWELTPEQLPESSETSKGLRKKHSRQRKWPGLCGYRKVNKAKRQEREARGYLKSMGLILRVMGSLEEKHRT